MTRNVETTVGDYAGMTATISILRGSTITISLPTRKYSNPRHRGSISTSVDGTDTSLTLRGTGVPTDSAKSTLFTRGAERSFTMTSWMRVRCSCDRLTDTPLDPRP